ncbi:hypothetical protein ACFE04_018257 [Oxalis oulophora]
MSVEDDDGDADLRSKLTKNAYYRINNLPEEKSCRLEYRYSEQNKSPHMNLNPVNPTFLTTRLTDVVVSGESLETLEGTPLVVVMVWLVVAASLSRESGDGEFSGGFG